MLNFAEVQQIYSFQRVKIENSCNLTEEDILIQELQTDWNPVPPYHVHCIG